MPAAYTLRSGAAGAVKVATASSQGDPTGGNPGNATAIGELSKWTQTTKLTTIKATNFGSPVDANGNVWPGVYKGTAEGQVEVEGHYDTTAATSSGQKIQLGRYYYLDLLVDKVVPFGIKNVFVVCTGVTNDVNAENQISKFNASFEITSDTSGTSTPPLPTGGS